MAAPLSPLPSNRRTGAFERRVARALAELGCATEDGRGVLVAASGGADSTATLVAVARALGAERVTAAHFDHRLRSSAEAARDAEAVAGVAARLGVTLLTGRAARRPVDHSEAAAREARYRWLARASREAGVTDCITGHTLDDQAETVLLRLARGAGALGVAGMRAAAPWPVEARGARSLRVLRPLLGVTRAEVEGYLDALGLDASSDVTNDTLDYTRNRVRHEVLPALRGVNARVSEHLAEFASTQREDDDALTAIALEWLDAHAERDGGRLTLPRRELRGLPVALGIRVIREAARALGVPLEASHLRAIHASTRKSGANVDLPLARSRTSGSLLELRTSAATHRGRD